MGSVPDFKYVFSSLKKLCSNALYLKKNDEGGIIIRSDMKELSDVERFVDLYQTLTHTEFNVLQSKHMTRCVFRKRWFCHFHGRTKPVLDYGCRASVDILIKKVTRSTARNDPFLKLKPPLPAVIKIHYPHTHPVLEKKFLRKNKMTNEMRKIFYEYFKHDIVGMNAKKLHLKLLREANFPYMDDRCINPRLDTIYRLHRFWLKEVAPKYSIEADPASEKEDGSSQLENIKKEDSCHEDFVNHMKETIIGLTSFDAEPSADIFDIESIKSEPVMDSAPKDNLSIKKERTESEDTVQDFICIANVSGNAIELANYRDQQRISCLNYMMNQYRPIMPKPVPGETNSKIEIPANNRIVSTPINPNILQSTKILHQKPILFSKHGVVKVNAIMIQNIKS